MGSYHRASWGKHSGYINIDDGTIHMYNCRFRDILITMRVLDELDDYTNMIVNRKSYLYNISQDMLFDSDISVWIPITKFIFR